MNNAESIIAVYHSVNYNSDSINVIDFLKGFSFYIYLSENTVNRFNTGGYACIFHNGSYALCYLLLYIIKEAFSLLLLHRKRIFNFLIGNRIKISNSKVFKLILKCTDTETVCNGSIYFKGFKAFFPLLIFRHVLKRSHIMQAVCKLYDDNSNILIHSNKHLADILCLNLLSS